MTYRYGISSNSIRNYLEIIQSYQNVCIQDNGLDTPPNLPSIDKYTQIEPQFNRYFFNIIELKMASKRIYVATDLEYSIASTGAFSVNITLIFKNLHKYTYGINIFIQLYGIIFAKGSDFYLSMKKGQAQVMEMKDKSSAE